MFNFEAFTFWIYIYNIYIYKKMVSNVMKRTNAMCKHVFTAICCLKSKLQNIHCSKQMWDLLTAVKISKGYHQTIGELDILCVFLGLGWILRKNVQF